MIELQGIEYIADKEAAHKYGYSRQWFQRCRHEKKGPPFVRLNGTKVLYRVDELERWFSENLK